MNGLAMVSNTLIDWKADDDNKLSLSVALGDGKLSKISGLSIKFILEGQYAVISSGDCRC
jgi:hypothetical protein